MKNHRFVTYSIALVALATAAIVLFASSSKPLGPRVAHGAGAGAPVWVEVHQGTILGESAPLVALNAPATADEVQPLADESIANEPPQLAADSPRLAGLVNEHSVLVKSKVELASVTQDDAVTHSVSPALASLTDDPAESGTAQREAEQEGRAAGPAGHKRGSRPPVR